jgi:hypothetical protein
MKYTEVESRFETFKEQIGRNEISLSKADGRCGKSAAIMMPGYGGSGITFAFGRGYLSYEAIIAFMDGIIIGAKTSNQ